MFGGKKSTVIVVPWFGGDDETWVLKGRLSPDMQVQDPLDICPLSGSKIACQRPSHAPSGTTEGTAESGSYMAAHGFA